MRSNRALKRTALPIATAVIATLAIGCGDGPTEVGTGALEVSTLTIGSAIDPDGYTVSLDGVVSRSIGVEDRLLVSEVSSGQHDVELVALANDCRVVGENPVSLTVTSARLSSVHFDVACPPFLNHIAFDGPGNGDFLDINVMNPDGSNPVNLTRHVAYDGWAAWSPDGMRIAFESDRDGDLEIFVMDADGSNVVNLTNNNEEDNHPTWSPDGSRIAFFSDRDGNWEIYSMRADGSNPVNLTNHPGTDWEPDWSPDGTRIAFIGDRHPVGSSLYVMDADGSTPTWLIQDSCIAFPDWSPDGARIAYQAQCTGGAHEIIVVDADGSNRVNLTNHPAGDYAPSWSPDGTRIAFSSDRDGREDIVVMREDGSNQVNLTRSAEYDGAPAWSPGP